MALLEAPGNDKAVVVVPLEDLDVDAVTALLAQVRNPVDAPASS